MEHVCYTTPVNEVIILVLKQPSAFASLNEDNIYSLLSFEQFFEASQVVCRSARHVDSFPIPSSSNFAICIRVKACRVRTVETMVNVVISISTPLIICGNVLSPNKLTKTVSQFWA